MMKRCVICRQRFAEWGNNPYPVADEGKCCNYCNETVVIPKRLEAMALRVAPVNNAIVSREQTEYKEYVTGLAEGVRQADDPIAALAEIYRTDSLATLAAVLKRWKSEE